MYNDIISNMAADSLASLVAKPSAGTLKTIYRFHVDGLVKERCNSSALAMELRFSCTNPSI